MSIIEQALDKTRGAARKRLRQGGSGDPDAERAERGAVIDPAKRIVGSRVEIDARRCRENRVLLNASATGDASAIASYRMLRTRLLQRARTKGWTTIGITSAGPNDGKTLTAINLSLSMSREKGREIVLLDFDMRNPSICQVLGAHPPHELRATLERNARYAEVFFSIGPDNLLIAGSLVPTEQASELLSSERFEEFLLAVREGTVNPIVLIDLPPVLLTDDALVVAPKIDAMLVVASEGVTGRADLAKAMHLLAEFSIAGVVLNRAVEATPGYDYGYESEPSSPARDPRD